MFSERCLCFSTLSTLLQTLVACPWSKIVQLTHEHRIHLFPMMFLQWIYDYHRQCNIGEGKNHEEFDQKQIPFLDSLILRIRSLPPKIWQRAALNAEVPSWYQIEVLVAIDWWLKFEIRKWIGNFFNNIKRIKIDKN